MKDISVQFVGQWDACLYITLAMMLSTYRVHCEYVQQNPFNPMCDYLDILIQHERKVDPRFEVLPFTRKMLHH